LRPPTIVDVARHAGLLKKKRIGRPGLRKGRGR
jgi:hypothetical protein